MEEFDLEQLIENVIEKTIENEAERKTDTKFPLDIKKMASSSITNLLNNISITGISKCTEMAETLKERILVIGDINEDTGDMIDAYIRFWNCYDSELEIPVEERTPIKICINSHGGDLMSTFTAVNAIENSITPVWTINVGMAYSGGFFILLAGHKRLSYRHSSFLFHEGSASNGGDANKFQNWADFYKHFRELMKDFVLEKTKITEEEYDEHVKDDWWFIAPEALKRGIIDDYVSKDWYLK